MALAAVSVLFSGCSGEDIVGDVTDATSSSGTSGGGSGSSTSSGEDSFTIVKTADGFDINWHKGYEGYSEIIYKDASNTNPRGNGYPFTNNYTGDYTLSCLQGDDSRPEVVYYCTRPDVTYGTKVRLTQGTQYQWLVSYGTEHDHGEVEYTMEYSGGMLTVE